MKAVVENGSQCDADNPPLDDWETAQSASAISKQLEERLKQVKILQREKADKDARLEKARQDEAISKATKNEALESATSSAPFVPPVKMQILRRPKSDDQLAEAAKAKKDQEKAKPKTLEEKQAAYEEARSRILGSDYKPDTTPAPQTSSSPVASRNRSPEQIRVRRPSPETMFVPCYQPPPQQYQMPPQNCNYPQQQPMPLRNFVPMTSQPYMYVDTSRPPPLIPSMAGPSNYQQQIPTFATGQYLGNPSDGQYMPSQVPYGRPPIPLFPPGSLGAAMQVVDSGQSQAQRKNRHKKKSKETSDAVY